MEAVDRLTAEVMKGRGCQQGGGQSNSARKGRKCRKRYCCSPIVAKTETYLVRADEYW